MNICLIYKRAGWVSDHILPSFAKLAHSVSSLDIRGMSLECSDSAIRNAIYQSKPDIIFMLEVFDIDVLPSTLAEARRAGARVLNYLVDTPQDWWKSIDIAEECDFILSAQTYRSEFLRRHGNRVELFPFSVSDQFAASALAATKQFEGRPLSERVLFIGSAHSRWRREFVGQLIDQQRPLDIVGAGWTAPTPAGVEDRSMGSTYGLAHHLERLRGAGFAPFVGAALHRALPLPVLPVGDFEIHGRLDTSVLQEIASRAKAQISTAVHGSGYLVGRPERQSKLRDVEMLCFGRPYITDAPVKDDFLDQKFPIISYQTTAEIPHILAEIENNPNNYSAMAKSGIDFIFNNHTWKQRFAYLSELLQCKFDYI